MASTVHPRARGEHSCSVPVNPRAAGSSPRTRGTLILSLAMLFLMRFIPAHAGNISAVVHGVPSIPVHPRARGEHVGVDVLTRGDLGSSPRTRGTYGSSDSGAALPRFIPAHAGNMASIPFGICETTVHPRARGEHITGAARTTRAIGSSPRTRGTSRHDPLSDGACRFIPAHAGNMTIGSSKSSSGSVHPRARGEHPLPPVTEADLSGSSPRTRGT